MSANLAALLYLVAGVLFILALRGLSSPATSRRGNRLGMIGMAIAIVDDAALPAAVGSSAWIFVVARYRHRRRHRRVARPHVADDGHAATRRRLPLAGRPRRGLRRRRRALCAASLRHRHAGRRFTRQSLIEMSIGVAIGADHLHRLGDRLREARRAHDRRADPAAAAPCDQHCVLAVLLVVLVVLFVVSQSPLLFWLVALVAFAHRAF